VSFGVRRRAEGGEEFVTAVDKKKEEMLDSNRKGKNQGVLEGNKYGAPGARTRCGAVGRSSSLRKKNDGKTCHREDMNPGVWIMPENAKCRADSPRHAIRPTREQRWAKGNWKQRW